MSAVFKGLYKEHSLLAAFLEATDKIDRRPLNMRAMANPINVEANQASAAPISPQVAPLNRTPAAPLFIFRRANLARVLNKAPSYSDRAEGQRVRARFPSGMRFAVRKRANGGRPPAPSMLGASSRRLLLVQAGMWWTSTRTPAFPARTDERSAPVWIGCSGMPQRDVLI